MPFVGRGFLLAAAAAEVVSIADGSSCSIGCRHWNLFLPTAFCLRILFGTACVLSCCAMLVSLEEFVGETTLLLIDHRSGCQIRLWGHY